MRIDIGISSPFLNAKSHVVTAYLTFLQVRNSSLNILSNNLMDWLYN